MQRIESGKIRDGIIMFTWSKGSRKRKKIMTLLYQSTRHDKPCFLKIVADKLVMSHSAAKKHVDILIKEGYISKINPKSKPIYLKLTKEGTKAFKNFK